MVDDPNRLWFQKEKYQHIQQKIYAIVDEAKNNGNKKERPTWLCTRGLESIMDRRGSADRQEAYASVMDEQRVQQSQGRYNEDHIRGIYQFHSIDAQVKASEIAEDDAKDVKNYLRVTRRMCRRMWC
jgi:hypothetical protein